jgi:hypothetical protein
MRSSSAARCCSGLLSDRGEAAAKEMAEIMDEAVQPGKFKEYLNVVTP